MLKQVCFLVVLAGALVSAAPSVDPRIVGGQNATKGQYPFAVSLQFCVGTSCQHACGGAIVARSWIVSGALCLTQVPSQGNYKALAGVLNLKDTNEERQERVISHAFIVPDYEGAAGPHDLAVFKTVTPFTYNSLIQPVRLPDFGTSYSGKAELVGWGSIGGSVSPIMPENLQTVEVDLLTFDACKTALDSILSRHPLDETANVCTGPITGAISACTGDQGTPLVRNNVLLGINTWIISPCGTRGAPSIQTKIAHYRGWILYTIDDF